MNQGEYVLVALIGEILVVAFVIVMGLYSTKTTHKKSP